MQILIPMGGAGSRFTAAGYDRPKPFIEFYGKTMIENVVENLGYRNHYTLVTQRAHYDEYRFVFDQIAHKVTDLRVVLLDGITGGAAESCLRAEEHIDPRLPLMIANCDQMMDWDEIGFKAWFLDSGLDGAILTFDSQSPKNSYAEVNDQGLVTKTAEKQVISKHATNGIYVWRKAEDFFSAAREMIDLDLKQNNEFYVCPTFNLNISWNQKIGIYKLENGCHWPIGTPEDLTIYLSHMRDR
jgi:NDP-sugar pyrophosphorylase family protein